MQKDDQAMATLRVGVSFMADAAEQSEIRPIKLVLEMRPIRVIPEPVGHFTARVGNTIVCRDDREADQFNLAVHAAALADLARFGKGAKAR